MKGIYKKSMAVLAVGAMTVSLVAACGNSNSQTEGTEAAASQEPNDIIVLYTNDVHCGIDGAIGYAGLAEYRDDCVEKTPFVTLVDVGDAIQGDAIGTVSDGEYPADIMNQVGYDIAILGNHEFDYGMEQLSSIIGESSAQYLTCNITYTGSGENALSEVAPYEIIEYGDTSVAFIGVATPESITKSTPAYFMENDEFVYDFCGESGEKLYECVQGYVDECTEKGADYIVVLSHLGDGEESSPFTSVELIQNTTGVDVVLDGHAHSVISCQVEQNKNGEDVLLSSTGTKLENIGQLVITANGNISTGLVSSYAQKDEEVDAYIKDVQALCEAELNRTVASSDVALYTGDANGIRLVRNRETAIGNLCADAYRAVGEADIALVNGGGIRADIPEGDITYADVIAVHPYGNALCVVEATGQEIVDALELGSRFTKNVTEEDGNAAGECGGFLQVSGLKYTIDTSVESSVVLDENDMFVSVDGARRVSDVQVLNDADEYEPIDLEKTYTVASHNYMLKSCGDGYTMFTDNTFIIDEGVLDNQILITYIKDVLQGELGATYSEVDGRITVK